MRTPVRITDHPRTDRWVSLVNVVIFGTELCAVAVVDGRNYLVSDLRTFSTPAPAQNYADKLIERNGGDATAYLQKRQDQDTIKDHERIRKGSERLPGTRDYDQPRRSDGAFIPEEATR